jgi:hypothetical protein
MPSFKVNVTCVVAYEVHDDQYIFHQYAQTVRIPQIIQSTGDIKVKLSTTTLAFNHPKFSGYKLT